MNEFLSYIGDTLKVDIETTVFANKSKLPLYLRSGYEFVQARIYNVDFILAKPLQQENLTVLRKQVSQLSKLAGLDCVLCLEKARIYTKEQMFSERIPFVALQQQIFMPFLGLALSNKSSRDILSIKKISTLTQRLLLTAIYDDWKQKTLTEIATALAVSKMSITRCFDELIALELDLIKFEKKLRCFIWNGTRRSLYEKVSVHFESPIARTYSVDKKDDIPKAKLSGMSALCHYSMLNDNAFTTYAISKEHEKLLSINGFRQVPQGEVPGMVLHVLKYSFDYSDGVAIDPISTILSLTDDEKEDPRVEFAINSVLEDSLDAKRS